MKTATTKGDTMTIEPAACAECGHLHWWGVERGYSPCPIEGCPCPESPHAMTARQIASSTRGRRGER